MKLLAIETATEACSVALGVNGEVIERHQVAPREHTQLVLPMVAELLAEAGIALGELDALVLGRGPGAFTGLRIAAGVVQGLAFSVDRPVVSVSTLAMLAQSAIEAGHPAVIAALDARMGEVYWGAYRADGAGLAATEERESVSPPAEVQPPDDEPWTGVGPGFAVYAEVLGNLNGLTVFDDAVLPRARHALPLAARDLAAGLAVPAEQAQPVYLRNRVAQTLAERG
ncbi:tRNA (adenosine(37)-N6)-threonylcarbamoyltransferase complex dimerization subunit type 1 TsaB [Acidihalobacter prosperus]|uniref:tRNA threonylcarbamoyladenosine biosynthesis protein TsaB n=1 Tax=Acidihalobacter prosperus TaxID=160660 RepID=A0A1A6C7I6_9GAMM|nr:tRNA (adenosine(37)-N6)-threonylcarbamoyltransferase complex dimerization subunit type 1 TsaB [Acidihalobacter prosperus]OBS10509.1 tRNA threonylcarbamoyladenosine biosynthesis protein TsaB [Acidihalobacter prosperus]